MRHLTVVADISTEVAGSTGHPVDRASVHLRDCGLADLFDDFEPRLDSVLEERPRTLVVDMSAVGQVSSATIAALLWIRRRCSTRGVEMVLGHPSRSHLDVLRRVGLLGVMSVEATEASGRPRDFGSPSRRG